jgi:hypothetical protein
VLLQGCIDKIKNCGITGLYRQGIELWHYRVVDKVKDCGITGQ